MTFTLQEIVEPPSVKTRTKCGFCRHAVHQCGSVYCTKLKKHVEDGKNCPYFELEPPEYRLYKRM